MFAHYSQTDTIFGELKLVHLLKKTPDTEIWRAFSLDLQGYLSVRLPLTDRGFEEIKTIRNLSHPLTVQYIATIQFKQQKALVTENVEGITLAEYISRQNKLNEYQARIFILEILSIMEHLKNDLNLIHLGIRADNILVDSNGNIRMIDFTDCVSCYAFNKPFTVTKDSPYVSDLAYVPPEYLNNQQLTMKTSTWNLGVLLFYMVVGKMPFTGYNNAAVMREIVTKDPVFPFTVSPELIDFIQLLLKKQIDSRLAINDVRRHTWLNPMLNSKRWIFTPEILSHYKLYPSKEEEINDGVMEFLSNIGFDKEATKNELLERKETKGTAAYMYFYTNQKSQELFNIPSLILQPAKEDEKQPVFFNSLPPLKANGTPLKVQINKNSRMSSYKPAKSYSVIRKNIARSTGDIHQFRRVHGII